MLLEVEEQWLNCCFFPKRYFINFLLLKVNALFLMKPSLPAAEKDSYLGETRFAHISA